MQENPRALALNGFGWLVTHIPLEKGKFHTRNFIKGGIRGYHIYNRCGSCKDGEMPLFNFFFF